MTGGLEEEGKFYKMGGGARVQDEPGWRKEAIWKVLGGAKLGSVVPDER